LNSKLFSEEGQEQSSEYVVKLDKKSPLSVYFCNYRSIYEDNYPAKFDEELARFLIKLYSNEGDFILDPMAGSGVICLVSAQLGRFPIYQDINEEAYELYLSKMENQLKESRENILHRTFVHDATKNITAHENIADLILTSPPFGMSIDQAHDKYSDNPDDIGNSKTYEIWRQKMKMVLKNCFQALKPGKLCILETRPRSKKGHSYPLNSWLIVDGIEVGFDFFCEYIEVVDTYRMWTFGKPDQRMPIPAHSYLTILRKPENEKLL
jgi:DNA modification methylase